jgi:hypothetical protein
MALESLLSPYAIRSGGNPYYDPTGNIAGLSDGPDSLRVDLPGDYDRYLQSESPFLAGFFDNTRLENWPLIVSTMTYGYVRQGGLLGVALGFLGGTYFPRATVLLYAVDAALSKGRGPYLQRA